MKWSGFFAILLISTQLFISCSDDAADDSSNNTASTSAPISSDAQTAPVAQESAAKEKKVDADAQGLKGKVEVLSESIYGGQSTKLASKNVFKYDDKGNRLELIAYDGNGKVISTIKSTYDASGNIIKEETILGNGNVDVTSTIKTDSKGNRIEQDDIRGGEALFNFKHTYKYDEKAQLIERTARRGNGSLFFRYNFTYDANGNKTEWIQTGPSNLVVGKVTYKYDNKNNLIEEATYRNEVAPSAVYTYTYEFDKKGNWTKRIKSQNGTVVERKERTISYQ